jgi:hypothetical protein
MGKRSNAARKPKGPLQQMLDREQLGEATRPLVNRFTMAHGDYERNLRFVRNRGATTVDRWVSAGTISESQEAAIRHCQRLWEKLGSRSIVVDFEKVVGQNHGEGYSQHEALTELYRISSGFPRDYWWVFEAVCRYDEPAGHAGSRLANNKRSSIDAARLVTCFIADLIAMRERLSY